MRIKDIVSIIRPINDLMVGFGVIIGYLMSIEEPEYFSSLDVLFGFLTGFFISGSVMVINDIFDLKIDKINQPWRPLPSGKISIKEAWILGLVFLLAGILTSIQTGNITFFIAILFWFLGVIYNKFLKKTPLIGNLTVSLSIAIPFIYGGLIRGGITLNLNNYLLSGTAFFINTYREVIKDIIDIEGDISQGLKTLPIVIGKTKSFAIASAFLLIGLLIGIIPIFIQTDLDIKIYMTMITITESILFLSWLKAFRFNNSISNLIQSKHLCLLGMFFGMITFMISKLVIILG